MESTGFSPPRSAGTTPPAPSSSVQTSSGPSDPISPPEKVYLTAAGPVRSGKEAPVARAMVARDSGPGQPGAERAAEVDAQSSISGSEQSHTSTSSASQLRHEQAVLLKQRELKQLELRTLEIQREIKNVEAKSAGSKRSRGGSRKSRARSAKSGDQGYHSPEAQGTIFGSPLSEGASGSALSADLRELNVRRLQQSLEALPALPMIPEVGLLPAADMTAAPRHGLPAGYEAAFTREGNGEIVPGLPGNGWSTVVAGVPREGQRGTLGHPTEDAPGTAGPQQFFNKDCVIVSQGAVEVQQTVHQTAAVIHQASTEVAQARTEAAAVVHLASTEVAKVRTEAAAVVQQAYTEVAQARTEAVLVGQQAVAEVAGVRQEAGERVHKTIAAAAAEVEAIRQNALTSEQSRQE